MLYINVNKLQFLLSILFADLDLCIADISAYKYIYKFARDSIIINKQIDKTFGSFTQKKLARNNLNLYYYYDYYTINMPHNILSMLFRV